jgi:putative transcriptional regulator
MQLYEFEFLNDADWGNFKAASTHQLETGVLILANPFMEDPNFKRAVILLAEHQNGGSLGFILNKPLDIFLDDVSPEFEGYHIQLYLGGPVQLNTLHFVHRFKPDILPGSAELGNDFYWGGDYDELKRLYQLGKVQDNMIRFLLGYAGWSPSQLKAEFNANSWIATKIPAIEFFEAEDEDEQLWRRIMQQLGTKRHQWLSNFPEDPQLN